MLKWLGLVSLAEHQKVVADLEKEVVEARTETNEVLISRGAITKALHDMIVSVMKAKEIAEVMRMASAMQERVDFAGKGTG
ncbi:hypothetical protein ACU8OR_25325 (plasmid) [Rhizobium leguminosarum]